MRRWIILLFLFFVCSRISIAEAQSNLQSDTVKLNSNEAEKIFLTQNLLLLAGKCNVEAARAMIIQAKLFNNPNFSVEQGLYDPDTKKVFDIDYTGNTGFAYQQLINLAGKRNKSIKLEQINTQRQEYLFYDLLRTLKFKLRSDFNSIFFQMQTLVVYDKEIASLKKLISVFEEQFKNGFVSKKDLVRLQASLFSLESEKLEISNSITELQADFGIMLHKPNTYFVPELNETSYDSINTTSLNLPMLIDTALQNRSDLKATELQYKWNEANLAYQKALSVPDLTLGALYSKQGSYVRDYTAITLAIDLPFFNRNQGNIKAAKFQADNSNLLLQSFEDNVKGDVIQAYTKVLQNEKVFNSYDNRYNGDLEKLLEEITKNYGKKNISLLEFIDFYDAYKENTVQLNTFLSHRLNAFEELNYSVGKNIINY